MAPEGLTDDQAAVYDRQLRLWGHEVQQRLTAAKVLIIGGDGLAAEIAKNLVLAGVGHVSLADDTPVSEAAFGNFLVPADAADPTTSCSSSTALQLQPEQISNYDFVISTCGLSLAASSQLEELCAGAGKQLYIGEVLGSLAYFYINLGPSHTYQEKQPDKSSDKPATEGPVPLVKTVSYSRLVPSLTRPASQCMGKRPPHPLYQVIRTVRRFEEQHHRQPDKLEDLQGLQAVASEIEASESAKAGTISPSLLEAWVQGKTDGAMASLSLAPVCAVAGGVIANSAVRAISKVGAPLKNWFFFSLHDGAGVVEDIGGPQ